MSTSVGGWRGSLHQTFRLLPTPSPSLCAFLSSDGLTPDAVLAKLPYDAARSRSSQSGTPNSKRYRDGRHVYQMAGLLYEDSSSRLRVTDLGQAVYRWLDKLTARNSPVLGRHAAYALSCGQLRNPSAAARGYESDVEVFPFSFIWRAMLELDDAISSEELNRCIFWVKNRADLQDAISKIRSHRANSSSDPTDLGDEVITGPAKNDRIIPWVSLASFGWLLVMDKRETGSEWYRLRPSTRMVLDEASKIRRKHQVFPTLEAYILHMSTNAALPRDVR